MKVLKRAEIESWPNLFSNGRKSAITDLLQDGHDVVHVAAWVGNSPQAIWGFYAMATGENRRRAAGGGRADGRRTATQTGRHHPEDPAKLWTYLWINEGQSAHIAAGHDNCGAEKTPYFTGSDEFLWAMRDSNHVEIRRVLPSENEGALSVDQFVDQSRGILSHQETTLVALMRSMNETSRSDLLVIARGLVPIAKTVEPRN